MCRASLIILLMGVLSCHVDSPSEPSYWYGFTVQCEQEGSLGMSYFGMIDPVTDQDTVFTLRGREVYWNEDIVPNHGTPRVESLFVFRDADDLIVQGVGRFELYDTTDTRRWRGPNLCAHFGITTNRPDLASLIYRLWPAP